MSETRPASILELCVARLGIIKGAQVVTFLGGWAFAMNKHADEWDELTLTDRVDRYRSVMALSHSTPWRHLDRYRLVFDKAPDPTTVVRLYGLNARVTSRKQALDPAVGLALPS